jgi:SAM-dependent methyltransferase
MNGPHERQALDATSPWWGEHVARYDFALPHVRGRRTLDVACGSGLGLPILQRAASAVVGVDGDAQAVARARLALPQMTVECADAAALPFADGTFSAVTTFETIEHLRDRPAFLREITRVLASDGVCILSTPNAHYTRPVDGKPRNPFHVHEYTPDELGRELAPFFSVVELLGQALDARFVVPPFWDDQQRLPRTLWNQWGITLRRIGHRLPGGWREPLSRRLWGHAFYPQPGDYHFSLADVSTAPVTVAVCRGVVAPQ